MGRRPSELIGVDCSQCAWCLDEALMLIDLEQRLPDAGEEEINAHRERLGLT